MISILIPVYNTLVFNLIKELSNQLTEIVDVNGAEIIVIDDCSTESFKLQNRSITELPHVSYIELEHNVGRVRIRKRLSTSANCPWLIFLDGDSKIADKKFLKNYLCAIRLPHEVIVGGRVYQQDKPHDCARTLHWKYGTYRENIVERRKGFLTNNFCIRKEVFDNFSFEGDWLSYGHEDTWMGIQMEGLNAKINYINNAVLHDGIDDASKFISKSVLALQNLSHISQHTDRSILRRHVRLYDHYVKIKNSGLLHVVKIIYKNSKNFIEANLHSCNPSLRLFDFYRLANFILINAASKNKQ